MYLLVCDFHTRMHVLSTWIAAGFLSSYRISASQKLVLVNACDVSFSAVKVLFSLENTLKLPIPSRTLDLQTYSGFYASWLMQLLGCVAYFVLYVLISLLQIGFCTYTHAIVDDFKAMMKDVEEHTRTNYGANTFRETDPYICHSFKEAVNMHAEMLEYFHIFSTQYIEIYWCHWRLTIVSIAFSFRIIHSIRDMFEGPLFYQFMGFVAFLAFALLFMDQSVNRIDIDTVYSMNLITCQSLLNLIACYYGDNLTADLSDIAECVYSITWYQFAVKERTFLPWIIRRSQKPFQLTGYKLISCSMSTFMKVYTILTCFWRIDNFWRVFFQLVTFLNFLISSKI